MHRFWDVAVRPLLELVDARAVVEIGAAGADNTRLIADWCRARGARATVVDPAPRFDVNEIHAPDAGIVIDTRLSLDALPGLAPVDVALVDGDHNHWTVSNELRLLWETARRAGRPAPVIVCHDVLWPYGRRDLYYDPDTIPAARRHPWRRAGMVPGSSALVDSGGLNPHLCNAEHEGGPANGVLTGIEDAIAGFDEPATLTILPVLYGLAIVVPASRAAAAPAVVEWVRRWDEAEGMRELLTLVEGIRRANDALLQSLTAGPPPQPPDTRVTAVAGRSFRSALSAPELERIQGGVLRTTYRGVRCFKSPFDLVLYSQLLDSLAPATVIEIGSKDGGSALWFADQQAARGLAPRVLAIDLENTPVVDDDRIDFRRGDAHALGAVLGPELLAALPRPWLVVEDSAHTYAATRAVLEFFDGELAPGDYIVVEDGIVADLPGPAYAAYEDGPNRATAEFLAANPDRYAIDVDLCDHFGHNVTWSPNGWLCRR